MSDNVHASASGGIGLVTVILALIFLFVWPGPFRYEYRLGPTVGAYTDVIRIDRISHGVWMWDYDKGKWWKNGQ